MNQKEWIYYLDSLEPTKPPFFICNYYKSIEGRVEWGKWVPLSVAQFPVDYRSILENEIVFDIDFQEWKHVKKFGDKILLALQMARTPHILQDTGGKGVHIHVFFKTDGDTELLVLLQKAIKKGFEMRHMRVALWNDILRKAEIDINFIGHGKPIDEKTVNWSADSKGHLIRVTGGKKPLGQDEIGDPKWGYKTVMENQNEIPERRTRCNDPDKVAYPKEVIYWKIPKGRMKDIINHFLSEFADKAEMKITKYEGVYTALPCAQRLVSEGNEEGQRHDGAGVIALACALDNMNEKETMSILERYRKSCIDRGGIEQFTIKELKAWIDWIRKQPNLYWNEKTCNLLKRFGTHCEAAGTTCKMREELFKDAVEFLKSPTLLGDIERQMDMIIVGEKENKLLLFFMYLSSYTNLRIHPQLIGPSSSGKSHMLNAVLDFIPEEDIILKLTSMSPKSLNYELTKKLETDTDDDIPNIDGKIIVVQEFEGAQEAMYVLRPLMSGDQKGLAVLTMDKDAQGRNVPKKMVVKGMPLFVTATTNTALDIEFQTRTWKLEADSTPELTKKIMRFRAEEHIKGEHVADKTKVISNAVRVLKQQNVIMINPYAVLLAEKMNVEKEHVRLRRDFRKICEFITISAWLHQFQRPKMEIDGKVHVIATLEDYEIIKKLILPSFSMIFEGTSDERSCYDTCKNMEDHGEMITNSELAKRMGWATGKVSKTMKNLDNMRLILRKKGMQREDGSIDSRVWTYQTREKLEVVFPQLNKEDLKKYYNNLVQQKDDRTSKMIEKILED